MPAQRDFFDGLSKGFDTPLAFIVTKALQNTPQSMQTTRKPLNLFIVFSKGTMWL